MRPAQISTDGCQQHYEGHNFQCHYLQREPLHSSLVGSRQRAGFEHLIRHLDQANRLQNLRHKLFHPGQCSAPTRSSTVKALSIEAILASRIGTQFWNLRFGPDTFQLLRPSWTVKEAMSDFFFALCCLGKIPGGAPFSQLHKSGNGSRVDRP